MLRKLRIIFALAVFAGIVSLFLLSREGGPGPLSWLAKWQFLPALLAGSVVIVAVLLLITLVFGRVYCSVLCPLGLLQDGISYLGSRRKGGKLRFTPSKEKKWLRYGTWALFVAALLGGVQGFVALLDPYGAFGRIMATASGKVVTLSVVIVAAVTFVVVALLSWKNGRTWCNTLCPVGTTLGFFSRFALFRPVIDTEKCKNCHLCEKGCKASCIDIAAKKIDYSRCVDCFDCLSSCKFGALHYRFARRGGALAAKIDPSAAGKEAESTASSSRRAFLSSAGLAIGAATLGAQSKKVDGGLAAIAGKQNPGRTVPLTPFGSRSVKDFYSKCTACQLCVSACPNDVLRPSTDLEHFMQPQMGYENGYCRPECTDCSKVCPAGAILPIEPAEKIQYHIGVASVDRSLCVVERDGVHCGNCARHCPVGAIKMVRLDPEDPESLRIPAVDEARCIGCGACENLCPSRPVSAITVNGLHTHIKD